MCLLKDFRPVKASIFPWDWFKVFPFYTWRVNFSKIHVWNRVPSTLQRIVDVAKFFSDFTTSVIWTDLSGFWPNISIITVLIPSTLWCLVCKCLLLASLDTIIPGKTLTSHGSETKYWNTIFIFHETFPLASWIWLEQDYRKLTQSELSLFGRKILNNSLSKQTDIWNAFNGHESDIICK